MKKYFAVYEIAPLDAINVIEVFHCEEKDLIDRVILDGIQKYAEISEAEFHAFRDVWDRLYRKEGFTD